MEKMTWQERQARIDAILAWALDHENELPHHLSSFARVTSTLRGRAKMMGELPPAMMAWHNELDALSKESGISYHEHG